MRRGETSLLLFFTIASGVCVSQVGGSWKTSSKAEKIYRELRYNIVGAVNGRLLLGPSVRSTGTHYWQVNRPPDDYSASSLPQNVATCTG